MFESKTILLTLKNKMTKLLLATSALITLVSFSTTACADTWTALDLGTLGGDFASAMAVNARGQVVGFADTSNGLPHAFITGANGVGLIDLGTLGGSDSYALCINDIGQVAGFSSTTGNMGLHAFITGANGVGMVDLGTFGGTFSYGFAINSSGQVAGLSRTYENINVINRAFLTGANGDGVISLDSFVAFASAINDSGQVVGQNGDNHAFITGPNGVGVTDLGTLGGTRSSASGINSNGQVTGSSETSNGNFHAFITGPNGAGMIDLGSLDGNSSFANGINSIGQVVGYSKSGADTFYHAFVTGANGVGMTDLNSLVSLGSDDYLTYANSINDQGQIAAYSRNGRAYLLSVSAVPEPENLAMLFAGLCLTGFITQRRKGLET